MKYIEKRSQPEALIKWLHQSAADIDGVERQWSYEDMPAPVREATKQGLLIEQGGLCCYTGRRISLDSSHIEHLKPQSKCMNHEDTDYQNMLAAYPSSQSGTPQCPYGAHARTNWYDEYMFIHPRRADCEKRFRYKDNGKIRASNQADLCAIETIKQLHLDHAELENMRKTAIFEALFAEDLSKKEVQQLMAAMDERDKEGNFRQFCFVIKQVCEKYLKRFK